MPPGGWTCARAGLPTRGCRHESAVRTNPIQLPERQEVLTVEFKINLLRPVTGRKIIAAGSVVKAGSSPVITEAEVTDADSGKPAAKMLATMIPAAKKEEPV